MNVKEGTRRLALVAGFVGLVIGLFPAHDSFLGLRRQITQHKEFESRVTSDVFKEAVRKSLPTLASEIRSTFPGAYEDLSDSEIEQKFSARVRQSEGPWEEYKVSADVKVRGPDNKLYLFPPGTTKDIAVAYFAKKERKDLSRPIQGTIPMSVEDVKSVTWANSSISYVTTQDGTNLYNTDAPSRWLYLLYASYPVFGFFVPWGAIRTVGWVVLGFQKH